MNDVSKNRSSMSRAPFFVGIVGRVLPVVLLILALSQGLSALLSVLSFERVYLQNLTANYEIAGKDVQRNIQRALKFGKRIDGFVGLQRFVEPLFTKLTALDAVVVSDPQGQVYFRFQPAPGAGGTIQEVGQVQTRFAVAQQFDWQATRPVRRSMEGRYAVMLPLVSPLDQQKAVLTLVFEKTVIEQAKQALVADARLTMGLTLVVAALLITILLRLQVFNRTRSKTVALMQGLQESGAPSRISALPVEMVPIYEALQNDRRARQSEETQIRRILNEVGDLAAGLPQISDRIRRMQQQMEQMGDDTSQHKA